MDIHYCSIIMGLKKNNIKKFIIEVRYILLRIRSILQGLRVVELCDQDTRKELTEFIEYYVSMVDIYIWVECTNKFGQPIPGILIT